MSEERRNYPEHEKLREIAELSQAIGEFLDYGLPKMNLALYERNIRDCECFHCVIRKAGRSRWHAEEELATAVDGRVQVMEWIPTHRSIQGILAEYFGIDQKKIDAEKEIMLADLRKGKGR